MIAAFACWPACDCGGCLGSDSSSGCAPDLSSCAFDEPCGLGGQCTGEGGTCPGHLQVDMTTTCGDGAGFCCRMPLPPCSQLGGTCQSAALGSCTTFELQGDCGDGGVCCAVPVPPEDAPSHDAPGQPTDAHEDAPDARSMGSCNGAACLAGCACEPSDPDAGGGVCQCAGADAGDDAESDAGLDADGGLDEQALDGSADAATTDRAVPDADGSVEANASNDAASDGDTSDAARRDGAIEADDAQIDDAGGLCGVIGCATGCTCVSQSMSACVCP